MKDVLLVQLSELFNEIEKISDSPTMLKFKVNEMLELIRKLGEVESSNSYHGEYSRLFHTLGKEVAYAESAYSKSAKKNAPKIRRVEYEKSLRKAKDQIKLDIFSLLI